MVATTQQTDLQSGFASLEVKLVSGKSTATSSFATNPLKLLVPRSRGQSVWAYTSSFGGGLVAGDETQLDLRLGENSRCFLGAQASTKIYRNPNRLPCGHRTSASLATGAMLVFAPDPVQAFAGSSYAQRQTFRLASNASLVFVDWFSSGRSARGERWEFKRLQTRTEIFVDDERVFFDALLLDADEGPLNARHRTGRFNCFATLLILGAAFRCEAETLLSTIAQRPVTEKAPVLVAASPSRDGALLRVAGEGVEMVARELQPFLSGFQKYLGDDPWARKW